MHNRTLFLAAWLLWLVQGRIALIGGKGTMTSQVSQCRSMPYPACATMPWKRTSSPLSTQEFDQKYWSLLDSRCNPYLPHLLCSVVAPPCDNVTSLPCRDVCEDVKNDCERSLQQHNLAWPPELSCHLFPQKIRTGTGATCLSKKTLKKNSKHSKGGKGSRSHQTSKLEVGTRLPVCNSCSKKTKLRKKIYLRMNYDFVLRANYVAAQHIKVKKGPLIVTMHVQQVLKQSKMHIPENSDITLWVDEGCVCPRLRKKYQYVILCHEDIRHNRLLFTSQCTAVKWSDMWYNRIKKWENVRERRLRRRTRRRHGREIPTI